VNVGPGTPKK